MSLEVFQIKDHCASRRSRGDRNLISADGLLPSLCEHVGEEQLPLDFGELEVQHEFRFVHST